MTIHVTKKKIYEKIVVNLDFLKRSILIMKYNVCTVFNIRRDSTLEEH